MGSSSADILRELLDRARAHSNGTLALLSEAGIVTNEVTLVSLKQLYETDQAIFERLIRFLYPEQFVAANADGSSWLKSDGGQMTMSVIGGALSGIGSAIFGNQSYNQGNEQAVLNSELAAKQERLAQQRTIIYVVGGVVAAALIAVIVLVVMRKR